MSEEVQVVGEAPLVRSNSAELGQVIEMKQIQALPLNGRFFEHLITLTPGAMPFYGRGDSAENASAAGAKIATVNELLGPRVVAKGTASALRTGLFQTRTKGHPAQLGGVLIVAPDGSVPYAHLADDASDNASNDEVLRAARKAVRSA